MYGNDHQNPQDDAPYHGFRSRFVRNVGSGRQSDYRIGDGEQTKEAVKLKDGDYQGDKRQDRNDQKQRDQILFLIKFRQH